MEHSPIKYPGDDDVEDGEISEGSDGGYTPLARPDVSAAAAGVSAAMTANHTPAIIKMEGASDKDDDDDDDDDSPGEASTDSDSDNAIIGQPRDRTTKKRALKIRLKALAANANNNKAPAAAATSAAAAATGPTASIGTAHRKNNIWAAGLQEESLMENLKGFGVDHEASSAYDRSVESYDYSLRFRLNGENALKRRKSSNSDSSNERPQTKYNRMYQNAANNRCRAPNGGGDGGGNAKHHNQHQHNNKRKNVKQRLGRRSNADDSSSNEAGQLDGPRIIADLDAIGAHSTVETVAKDLAGKLHEEKDELMLRIVEILGNELPVRVFAETQRIESEGGMLIMNGKRRRTPGGVFLFLLKNSDDLSAEHRKAIFTEESRKQNREQKLALAQKRDRKVEQLKQTLRIENELTALATRGNGETPQQMAAAVAAAAAAGASSPSPRRGGRDESLNNLSNPPPSPVTDGNRENSSDYDTHEIKHVLNMAASPEKMAGAPDVLTVTGAAASAVAAAAAAVAAAGSSNVATGAAAVAYDDEFLDMHCDDMDMF